MSKQQARTSEYFLGAVTHSGFTGDFEKTMTGDGYFTFILKGGAGTGKSSLMKKIAAAFPDGEREIYHCSSDPESLDAVKLGEYKTIVVDGTAPHTFDPVFPGVGQVIVNLGDLWAEKKLLANADGIAEAMALNRSYMDRAKRYTGALIDICFDTCRSCSEALDTGGIKALADRLSKRLITGKGSGGSIFRRQLSAVTMQGYKTYDRTISGYSKVYRFSDEYFAASSLLLDELTQRAVSKGYDVMICVTQLLNDDAAEHIFIPELDTAFVTQSRIKGDIGTGRTVSLQKYYSGEVLSSRLPRLKINRALTKTMLDETAKTLTLAKQAHDEIERYYIAAMDFKKLDKLTEKLIERIAKRKI